jgi:hypothetical protein
MQRELEEGDVSKVQNQTYVAINPQEGSHAEIYSPEEIKKIYK